MKKLAFLLLLIFAISIPAYSPTLVNCEEKQDSLSAADYAKLMRQAGTLMQAKNYSDALQVLLTILQYRPDDAGCWYNAACCAALLKDEKKALEYLEKSFENGYINFSWAEEDPDLKSIRNSSKFKALLRKKDKYYKIANDKRFEWAKEYFKGHYQVTRYDDERIIFVSDTEETKYMRLLEIISRVNKNHSKYLFKNQPDVYNIVLLPAEKEEYNKHYPPMNVLGVFMPGTKTLFVDLNVGEGTLVHEYTHALHFADMEALGQSHPIWIIEGFATLYENSSYYGLTQLRPKLGFRLMALNSMLDTPAYVPLEKMMKYQHPQFMARAGACYAESMMMMYWLYRKGLVRKFYFHYIENYRTDDTGIFSLEQTLGKPLKEIESDWIKFVKSEAKGLFDTKVSLGVKLTMAALNCLVFEVDEDSPAAKAGIVADDVILAYNGKSLKSSTDLTEALSKEKPGNKAKLLIQRGTEKLEVVVEFPSEEMVPGTGYLGVQVKAIKDIEGLLIEYVAKDGPADKAGVQKGDLLIEIDGERMEAQDDFTNLMAMKCPTNTISLLVKRDGKTKKIRVKLGKKPTVTSGINPGV